MKKYAWKEIDPVLLQAALALDSQERRRLLKRVAEKTGMTQVTLRTRQRKLNIFHLQPQVCGPTMINEYQAHMEHTLRAHFVWTECRALLAAQVGKMRAHVNRSISFDEAASLLRVHRTHVEAWATDLEIITLDEKENVPLPELRRFLENPRSKHLIIMARAQYRRSIQAKQSTQ